MKKIDRLGWVAGISFVSYGVRVGIRTNRPEALERMAERLPPGWKPAKSPVVDMLYSFLAGGEGARPGVRRYNIVYADIFKLVRTMNFDEALDRVESDIQLYVAEFASRRIFVHAGVVGWRGRAILIPGRSYSGKSTLVAELVRAGAEYYSDEYAVLDHRGRVHPYPRSLGIRQSPVELPKKLSVESMGGRTGSKPLPVGMVIASHYSPGAKWRPRKLSPGQGALTLLRNTVPAQRQPELALSTLSQAVSGALILKGHRGEAAETVDAILRKLDESSGDHKD